MTKETISHSNKDYIHELISKIYSLVFGRTEYYFLLPISQVSFWQPVINWKKMTECMEAKGGLFSTLLKFGLFYIQIGNRTDRLPC